VTLSGFTSDKIWMTPGRFNDAQIYSILQSARDCVIVLVLCRGRANGRSWILQGMSGFEVENAAPGVKPARHFMCVGDGAATGQIDITMRPSIRW
jgi:hypothetical protein